MEAVVHYPVTGLRLCFDEKPSEGCSGRIYGTCLPKELVFRSSSELLTQIDEAYNFIGRPQSTRVLRSFGERQKYQSYQPNPEMYFSGEEVVAHTGKAITLDLVMVSRRNAEWQGVLRTLDGQGVGRFATVLQFTNLLLTL